MRDLQSQNTYACGTMRAKQERLPCRPQADETRCRQSKNPSKWKFGRNNVEE